MKLLVILFSFYSVAFAQDYLPCRNLPNCLTRVVNDTYEYPTQFFGNITLKVVPGSREYIFTEDLDQRSRLLRDKVQLTLTEDAEIPLYGGDKVIFSAGKQITISQANTISGTLKHDTSVLVNGGVRLNLISDSIYGNRKFSFYDNGMPYNIFLEKPATMKINGQYAKIDSDLRFYPNGTLAWGSVLSDLYFSVENNIYLYQSDDGGGLISLLENGEPDLDAYYANFILIGTKN